jgi:hypothetical protein
MFIMAKINVLIRFVKDGLIRCEVGTNFERIFGIIETVL